MKAFIAAALAIAASFAVADHVPLTFIPSGGMPKFGRFMPMHLEFTAKRPAGLRETPPLTNPMFGLMKFGRKDHIAVLDEQVSGLKLYIDANGNGDLTDEPPADWKTSQYNAQDKKPYTLNRGSATVNLAVDGKEVPVALGVYKFDKADPDHPDLVNTVMYYCDYASEGQMTLDGKSYHVVLVDWESAGIYPTTASRDEPVGSGLELAIDINGNGQFEARGERFDAWEPINIAGTTIKITKVDPNGFDFAKASKPVPAVPLPPDVGEKAPSFTAKTIDGASIPFPSRYRGKLVMLFFWAISDDHSTKEIPGLVKVYEKFHAKGFEVLGISADLPEAGKGIAKYAKEHGMTWLQTFEPYTDRYVIDLFVVRWLPAAFLIDGDTGKILAKVDSLRGDKLATTIEKALAKKRERTSKR